MLPRLACHRLPNNLQPHHILHQTLNTASVPTSLRAKAQDLHCHTPSPMGKLPLLHHRLLRGGLPVHAKAKSVE